MLADAEPTLRRLTTDVIATVTLTVVYRREARLSRQIRTVIELVVAVIDEHADRHRGVRRG